MLSNVKEAMGRCEAETRIWGLWFWAAAGTHPIRAEFGSLEAVQARTFPHSIERPRREGGLDEYHPRAR
jgi:hypothetical protein